MTWHSSEKIYESCDLQCREWFWVDLMTLGLTTVFDLTTLEELLNLLYELGNENDCPTSNKRKCLKQVININRTFLENIHNYHHCKTWLFYLSICCKYDKTYLLQIWYNNVLQLPLNFSLDETHNVKSFWFRINKF